MLPESSFVPFQTSTPEGQSWLIFSTQPMDEILGLGGTLCNAVDRGVNLTIVYFTAGEITLAAGPAVTSESRQICSKLKAESIFIDWPERGIPLTALAVKRIYEIIRRVQPDTVFFPSPSEFHPDRRQIAALVWSAQRRMNFKGQLYHYEIFSQGDTNLLSDISDKDDRISGLLNLYKSVAAEFRAKCLQVVKGLSTARTFSLPDSIRSAEAFLQYPAGGMHLRNVTKERHFHFLNGCFPSDNPMISVLICPTSTEKGLTRLLESLSDQIYAPFLEVLVVNRIGPELKEMLTEFSDRFSGLHSLDVSSSMSLCAALNTAIIRVKGSFLSVLSENCTLDKGHFQRFVGSWRRNPNINVFYSGVNILGPKDRVTRTMHGLFDPGMLMHIPCIPMSGVTFHRRFIDMGCRFDESLSTHADWDFLIQLMRLSHFHRDDSVTCSLHEEERGTDLSSMDTLADTLPELNRIREKWDIKWTVMEKSRLIDAIARQVRNEVDEIIRLSRS